MHPLLASALRSSCHHPQPEIDRLLDQAQQTLEAAPALTEQFAAELITGKSLAQCLDISDRVLEKSYQAACQLVNEEEFQAALILSSFVLVAGHREARFTFKVASCLQHLGDATSAADFYKLSLQIDHHHMGAAYRLGECLHRLGDQEQARHLFAWTVELARGNFAFRKIQAAAESQLSRSLMWP
ncbi:MAG: CDC27 family protein [Oxalobacteraceae bacterium]